MIARAVLVSLLFTFLADRALALGRDRTIRQFHHTTWTAKDGAPSQIGVLAQTTDGYLWIGTARGLFRFDGVRFERYSAPDGEALPSTNILGLMATADGGLWISSRYGLGFLKDGRLTVFTQPDDTPKAGVLGFAADQDGRVWAGTVEGLALRSGSRWLEIGSDWNVERGAVATLMVDRQGTLWASIERKLWFLRRGSKKFEDSGIRAAVGFKGLAEPPDGAIWIAERFRSVHPVRIGQGSLPSANAGLEFDTESILFDRDGNLWAARGSHGMVRMRFPETAASRLVSVDDPLIERYGEQDGLSGDLIFALFEDIEGTIWVGTNKGLDRFRYSHVVPVSLPADIGEMTLLAGDSGDVWVGSTSTNLVHVHDGRVIASRAPPAASVFREPRGDVWWGGYAAIWRQRGKRIDLFPLPARIPRDWVLEVLPDGADALWIRVLGTPGLIHFKDGVWSSRPPPQGLLARGPSATYQDSTGRIWFGYGTGRVDVLDDGRVTVYGRDNGLDIGGIKVIRGRGPEYWFGGELGLAVFREGRFRSVLTETGQPFETVSGIIETADGTLWLNELRGVVRIPPDEVRNIVANPKHGATFQLLDHLDGLPGAPQMNFTVSTAVETTDGRLWFATDNGLARIDPAAFQTNKIPPPVLILSPAPNVRFPAGTEGIHLRYAALSLSIPERVVYRYKLEGFDKEWQDAGARREAFYTNLRPDKYTFRVMAANHDGVWNEAGSTLAFEISPAFFQTRWFMVLAVALVAGLLWMGSLLRLRTVAARLRRLHEERLDERTRIARELHDTLLQGFLSASMQLHLAADQLSDDSPAKPIVTNVIKLVADVSEEGRQAVRGLRPSEREEPLELAFSRAKREFADQQGIAFGVAVEGQPRALHPSIRDEIYRIGREALVNAFKHSAARNIEVELEYRDNGLTLHISDDGRGIDPRVLESRRHDHWGLAGVKERAQRIGAQLTVSSSSGAGTDFELSVPAHVAYRGTLSTRPLWSMLWLFRRSGAGRRGAHRSRTHQGRQERSLPR